MRVVYMAHPVGAPTPEGVIANIKRAKRWYRRLCDTQPDCAFVANWIVDVEVFHDMSNNVMPDVIIHGEPEHEARLRGLERDDAVIRVCDEYWMVGGRISGGVDRGRVVAERADSLIVDLTHLGDEPPDELPVIDDSYLLADTYEDGGRAARKETA